MDAEKQRRQLLESVFERSARPAWTNGRLLRSGEVAALLQVSRRAVSEWARTGKLPSVMTPGGQRRFPAEQLRELLEAMGRTR